MFARQSNELHSIIKTKVGAGLIRPNIFPARFALEKMLASLKLFLRYTSVFATIYIAFSLRYFAFGVISAHVAQLVEQRFRKAQVGGSTPLVGFLADNRKQSTENRW